MVVVERVVVTAEVPAVVVGTVYVDVIVVVVAFVVVVLIIPGDLDAVAIDVLFYFDVFWLVVLVVVIDGGKLGVAAAQPEEEAR